MKKLAKFLLRIIIVSSKIISASTMTQPELDTAFVAAIKESDLKKIEQLIAAGADVNTPIPHIEDLGDCDYNVTSSPFMFAVKNNNKEMLKVLSRSQKKINTTMDEALEVAICEGYASIVKELINLGANVHNIVDKKTNDTVLILAIKRADPIGQFYREASARIKSRWKSRREIIQILLDANVDINHVNNDGSTALIEAIRNRDLDTVVDLSRRPEITRGAFFGFGKKPINFANNNGDTALIIAVKCIRTSYIGTEDYYICLNSQKIVEVLLQTPGIDLAHVNKKGQSAITLLEELQSKNWIKSL